MGKQRDEDKDIKGDDPNMDNSFSFANAQRDNGFIWDLSGHDHLFHSLQVDESGSLAQGITSLIPSIRGIVPPGYKALLDKIQQLETRLLYITVQIQPQEQVLKIDDLKGCLQVVGETILQLTMDLTSILRHEGPAKILFHNLQRLQRTLVEKVSLEMAKLEMVGLTTSSEEAQYGLGGSRGNGTDDQTIDGNSHGIAYTQPMNSQNTPHGMQVIILRLEYEECYSVQIRVYKQRDNTTSLLVAPKLFYCVLRCYMIQHISLVQNRPIVPVRKGLYCRFSNRH